MRAEQHYYLPPGYRLERDADILTLRRADGSFLSAFSARGFTAQAVVRAAKDDSSGYPAYTGPQEHADSVRRVVKARMESSWERFLRTERQMLESRKNGHLAGALTRRLPTESQEELDRIASEERRRAKEGFVALRSEEGQLYYKHLEDLSPEDRMDRIRAELGRIEWLLERQDRRNMMLRSAFFGQRRSRRSKGSTDRT